MLACVVIFTTHLFFSVSRYMYVPVLFDTPFLVNFVGLIRKGPLAVSGKHSFSSAYSLCQHVTDSVNADFLTRWYKRYQMLV